MMKAPRNNIERFLIEELRSEYKVYDEIPYTLNRLKNVYSNGYGAIVFSTGGGYSDNIEFGNDMRKSLFVKKVLEKNKLDIILNNAKLELRYAIEPKLKLKGRKLFIRITQNPV